MNRHELSISTERKGNQVFLPLDVGGKLMYEDYHVDFPLYLRHFGASK